MSEWEKIKKYIPASCERSVDFDELSSTVLGEYIEKMKRTPQNPAWHAEGDVWTHTKMVLNALVSDMEYAALERRRQEIVFTAALLHDIGKTACTVFDCGVWKSPKHARVGADIARELLWRELGICGDKEHIQFRESVALLICFHGMPMHIGKNKDAERELIEMASYGECACDFSLGLLRILVRADIEGRICADNEASHDNAELAFMMAEELGILDEPYAFSNEITKHAYLSGKDIPRDAELYDDTWKEVILLSGLPASGKDTWIRENCPHLPMISLDRIRAELGVSPSDRDGQGQVIAKAKQQAKMLLRNKMPFVWNATNISPQIRKKLLDLFERYGAYTHIVYLESALDVQLERNRERDRTVPEHVIEKLLSRTELPTAAEAYRVEWLYE